MPDEGVDLGTCAECGEFGQVFYIPNPGKHKWEEFDEVTVCEKHLPFVLNAEDFDMIFEKAGVPHQPDTLLKQLRSIFRGLV